MLGGGGGGSIPFRFDFPRGLLRLNATSPAPHFELHFEFTSGSLRFNFDFILTLLRGFTTLPCRFQCNFIEMSHRADFDFTSNSLSKHFVFSSNYFDTTSISRLLHFDFTFDSVLHVDVTSFDFDSTSISLRLHLEFTFDSFRFHSDPTSMSLRSHFELT